MDPKQISLITNQPTDLVKVGNGPNDQRLTISEKEDNSDISSHDGIVGNLGDLIPSNSPTNLTDDLEESSSQLETSNSVLDTAHHTHRVFSINFLQWIKDYFIRLETYLNVVSANKMPSIRKLMTHTTIFQKFYEYELNHKAEDLNSKELKHYSRLSKPRIRAVDPVQQIARGKGPDKDNLSLPMCPPNQWIVDKATHIIIAKVSKQESLPQPQSLPVLKQPLLKKFEFKEKIPLSIPDTIEYSSEEEEFLEEQEVPWVEFEYHTTVKRWFLEWRVLRKGSLPSDLIPILIGFTARVNSVNLVTYQELVRKNDVVIKYKVKWIATDYNRYKIFCAELDNFFYHNALSATMNGIALSLGNSVAPDRTRRTMKHLSLRYWLTGTDSWKIFRYACALIGTLLIARRLYMTGFFKTYIGNPFYAIVKWVLSKLVFRSVGFRGGAVVPKPPAFKVYEVFDWQTPAHNRIIDIEVSKAINPQSIGHVFNHQFPCKTASIVSPGQINWEERYKRESPLNYFWLSVAERVQNEHWGTLRLHELWTKMDFDKAVAAHALNNCLVVCNLIRNPPMNSTTASTTLKRLFVALMGRLWYYFFPKVMSPITVEFHGKALLPCNFKYDKCKCELISTFPEFSVYFEEFLKSLPGGLTMVTWLERIKYGDWRTHKWHSKSMAHPLFERIDMHFARNTQKPSILKEMYLQFLITGKHDMVTTIEPITEASLPRRELPTLIMPQSFQYATQQNGALPEPKKNPGTFSPILWATSEMAVPSNTYENMCACIDTRVNAQLNSVISDQNIYAAYKEVMAMIPFGHIKDPNWFSSLKARQKKNLKEAEKDLTNGVLRPTIKAQLKTDEMINAKDKFVPRFLCNLSGHEFLMQGQQTSEISEYMSSYVFSSSMDYPIEFRQRIYTSYFSCGATSCTLNTYYRAALSTSGVHFMVLGDDQAGTVCLGEGSVIENDFKSYDRSQSKFLRDPLNSQMLRWGFGELISEKEKMYKKTVRMYPPRDCNKKLPTLKDKAGKVPDMRFTGEAATCLDNSIINIAATIAAYDYSIDNNGEVDIKKMEYAYSSLGLSAKLKKVAPNRATYLKGIFLYDRDGLLSWVRLPSFLLKFGKVLEDINIIDPRKNVTLNLKCRAVLRGMWLGYGKMNTNWFYTGIDTIIRRLTDGSAPIDMGLEFWQVKQDETHIPDVEWNSFMMDRYNISVEEQIDFIDLLGLVEAHQLPTLYWHPIFKKLISDY